MAIAGACGASACGTSELPARSAARQPPPIARAAAAPVHAIHGEAIALLAVTPGGDAAVTADASGHLRVWPTFAVPAVASGDAGACEACEPFVVDGPPPRALGIARDADGAGFAIADLDGAGYVTVQRWTAAGAARGPRVQLVDEAVAIDAVASGFVATLADRTLAFVDLDGGVRARLAPDPGVRVVRVIAGGGGTRAVAILESAAAGEPGEPMAAVAAPSARWIDLASRAWGAPIAVGAALDPARALLSADGAALVATAPCDKEAEPIGFVDAKTVACAVGGAVRWWRGGEAVPAVATAAAAGSAVAGIAAGGRVVAGNLAELELAVPERVEYLGYDAVELPEARITERGIIVGRGRQAAQLLDRGFVARGDVVVPAADGDLVATPTRIAGGGLRGSGAGSGGGGGEPGALLDLVQLDARDVLVVLATAGARRELVVYDTVAHVRRSAVALATSGADAEVVAAPDLNLAYDAATGLALTDERDGGGDRIARTIDATTHAIGPPIRLRGTLAWLADPARANGAAVIVGRPHHGGRDADHLEIEELAVAGLARHVPLRAYAIAGTLRGVDRTGRFYVALGDRAEHDGGDLTLYDHGELATFEIAHRGPATAFPDPSGELVALATRGGIALYTRDGALRWEIAAPDAVEIAWVDGALIARFATGLARIDLATGDLVARRCGWGFGRFATPRTAMPENPLVCDA